MYTDLKNDIFADFASFNDILDDEDFRGMGVTDRRGYPDEGGPGEDWLRGKAGAEERARRNIPLFTVNGRHVAIGQARVRITPGARPWGGRGGMKKVDYAVVRQLRAGGMSGKEIAVKLNCSKNTVYRICA